MCQPQAPHTPRTPQVVILISEKVTQMANNPTLHPNKQTPASQANQIPSPGTGAFSQVNNSERNMEAEVSFRWILKSLFADEEEEKIALASLSSFKYG
jgi:hypothetical protein